MKVSSHPISYVILIPYSTDKGSSLSHVVLRRHCKELEVRVYGKSLLFYMILVDHANWFLQLFYNNSLAYDILYIISASERSYIRCLDFIFPAQKLELN